MNKPKKGIIIISLILLAIISIVILIILLNLNKQDKLLYTEITQQDIRNIISSTGTVEPEGSVEVGTQVSGTIKKIYVDYNENVKKGDLLAELDTTLLEIAVKQAESNLINKKAKFQLNEKVLENKKNLYQKKLISDYEYESVKLERDTSYAEMLSASTDLQKAEADLDYAYIRSPIDGMILDKNVEEGQTVSASLSAPTLFILAKDLIEMELHALVDESDISKIKKDQSVIFTVDAFEEKEFNGLVREVRLNPTIESNVVNYSVIINADNKDKLLYPGMTATIDFIIEESRNAYTISNEALRFTPTNKIAKKLKKKNQDFQKKDFDPIKPHDKKDDFPPHPPKNDKNQFFKKNGPPPEFMDKKNKQNEKNNNGMLWFINDNNEIDLIAVKKGITDGQYTEIKNFDKKILNKKIIKGIATGNDNNTTENKSKNNKQNNQRSGPPPRMF